MVAPSTLHISQPHPQTLELRPALLTNLVSYLFLQMWACLHRTNNCDISTEHETDSKSILSPEAYHSQIWTRAFACLEIKEHGKDQMESLQILKFSLSSKFHFLLTIPQPDSSKLEFNFPSSSSTWSLFTLLSRYRQHRNCDRFMITPSDSFMKIVGPDFDSSSKPATAPS